MKNDQLTQKDYRKRLLLVPPCLLVVLVIGYALGTGGIGPIQKPNQQLTVQLTGGVLITSVTIGWTSNTVLTGLSGPTGYTGTLTVTSDPNSGTGSSSYTLVGGTANVNVTMSAPLLAATQITVKS